MARTNGPRPDDPPLPVFYPPGFEPSPTDDSDDLRTAGRPAGPATPWPTISKPVARRPITAGFLGTALVTLIGFSGGLLAAPVVSGFGGSQSVSHSRSAQSTTTHGAIAPSTTGLNPLAPPRDGADD